MISNVCGVICDLVFGSQIQQGITASGLTYRSLRSVAEIEQQLARSTKIPHETLWIVNLAAKSANEPELVTKVLPILLSSGGTVVCYAPHVEEARMSWAESIGASHVVARGGLMKAIGEIILIDKEK